MPGYTPVHLEVKGPRDAVLMQDGVDLIKTIGGVKAVKFEVNPTMAPVVTLELMKPFSYDGPAEIQVIEAQRPAVAVIEFLNAVNPAELEAAALEVSGSGLTGPSVAESFLISLKALAHSLDDA